MSKAQKVMMSPEEKIRRGIIAKMRFRAAIRMVIANLGWIGEIDEHELGDDVHKNVAVLTSTHKKGLLTIKERSIMMKPAEYRTEEEKKHLNRVIGGFKCFRKYPTSVKAQLAAVTYFRYYKQNRTIFYQNGPPEAIYFVLTGELQGLRKGFDPILNTETIQGALIYGPGSVIGDISCLHDKPRAADLVTQTPCELLLLKKSDFDIILKATIQEEWNEMTKAMSNFSYFDSWSSENITDCVLMMKIVSFKPEQKLLGHDVGFKDYVYFLCQGKVQIIEELDIVKTTFLSRNRYCLFNKEPSIVEEKERGKSFRESVVNYGSHIGAVDLASVSAEQLSTSMSSGKTKMCDYQKTFVQVFQSSNETVENKCTNQKQVASMSLVECLVCILHKSACFNIGENLENRTVVAMTPSKCMLIPRYWLMKTNIGNIWNKVREYLERTIPKKPKIFKKIIENKEWTIYRRKLADDIINGRQVSGNHYSNIPYSIRMREAIKLD